MDRSKKVVVVFSKKNYLSWNFYVFLNKKKREALCVYFEERGLRLTLFGGNPALREIIFHGSFLRLKNDVVLILDVGDVIQVGIERYTIREFFFDSGESLLCLNIIGKFGDLLLKLPWNERFSRGIVSRVSRGIRKRLEEGGDICPNFGWRRDLSSFSLSLEDFLR